MKKNTYKIFWILLCLIFSIPAHAFCDMVYLKNGDSIEGIVEKEDEFALTLNIGYGKIALLKKDIDYIARYTPERQNDLKQRWSSIYFMRPEFIPDDLKGLANDFIALEALRDVAIKNKGEKDGAAKNVERLENELKELNANLISVTEKLSTTKPEDALEEYNTLVNEFNLLIAKIKLAELNKNSFQKDIITLDKKVSGYINDFWLFKKRFADRFDAMNGKQKVQGRFFFAGVKKKLDIMEGDFTKHTIGFERYGLGITVEAWLNGVVKANLIVDTGAGVVVISKEITERLGLAVNSKESTMLVTLADGRQVKARSVILESIKVGDVEVKNTQAAVLINSLATEKDGLLGMSFLENFLVSIDVKGNRLILEEFNP